MSDLNDLIHTNAVIAFQQGEKTERNRIVELLEHMPRTDNDRTVDAPTLIELIKGEQK